MKQIHKIIRRNYVKRADVVRINPEEGSNDSVEIKKETPAGKNKKTKKETKMGNVTNEQLNLLEGALDMTNTKVVKKDRGLIERTESSKIILTEDNRQVLTD